MINHPHHATHLTLTVAATAALLTAAFHFLTAEYLYGVSFAVFMALLVVGMHVVAAFSSRSVNSWAYIFLVPASLALVAEILYANPAVRALGFLIVPFSLAFFAYWFTAPRILFAEVKSFWPWPMIRETVFPFPGMSGLTDGVKGGRATEIIVGVVIALPFLFIIGLLFASADQLFGKVVSDLIKIENLPSLIAKTVRDVIILLYFLAAGWTLLRRATETRRQGGAGREWAIGRTAAVTFLGLLNALFIIFLIFQFAYFFGGEAIVKTYGLTYADYARSGFFQLLVVAGIVFALSGAIYRVTEFKQWATRELAFLLILQTGVVIASAGKRLWLYTDAYGLTVSRIWAVFVVALVAAVLAALVVFALSKRTYSEMSKFLFLGSLFAVSAFLLVNVEGLSVKINANRFLAWETKRLDLRYMSELSSDAVPAMVELAKRDWPTDAPDNVIPSYSKEDFMNGLIYRRSEIADRAAADWRNPVLADYLALSALATLK